MTDCPATDSPGPLDPSLKNLIFIDDYDLRQVNFVFSFIFLCRMRETGQFLLALTCALEIVHQCSHFVFFYNVTLGPTFIDYTVCIKFQSASTAAVNSLQIALTVIAVDRLFATAIPFLYAE